MVDDYPEHKIQFYILEIRIASADVLFFHRDENKGTRRQHQRLHEPMLFRKMFAKIGKLNIREDGNSDIMTKIK